LKKQEIMDYANKLGISYAEAEDLIGKAGQNPDIENTYNQSIRSN